MITLDRAATPAMPLTSPTPQTPTAPSSRATGSGAVAAFGAAGALALVPLHDCLWRVTRPDGEVLGYVEALEGRDGRRFRAKRVNARLRRFVNVGEFWEMHDAVECFANG